MSTRLSEEQRAAIEDDLIRAEYWAEIMEQHGQSNTVHHENVARLKAALEEDAKQYFEQHPEEQQEEALENGE